jgi:hypothetical protein
MEAESPNANLALSSKSGQIGSLFSVLVLLGRGINGANHEVNKISTPPGGIKRMKVEIPPP